MSTLYQKVQRARRNAGSNLQAAARPGRYKAIFRVRAESLWDRQLSVVQQRRLRVAQLAIDRGSLGPLTEEQRAKVARKHVFGGHLTADEQAAIAAAELFVPGMEV